MEKENSCLKVNISTSNGYLCKNEEAIINIAITNLSGEKIENGLFRLNMNLEYIDIINEKLKICVTDFASIGSIEPRQTITINMPIKVKKIPKGNKLSISSFINFHIIRNEDIIDQNYESDNYELNFYDLNILQNEDFKIETFKDEYLIDEDIYFFMSIKNRGNSDIENIIIENFIPDKTNIVKSSVVTENKNNIDLSENEIIIRKLVKNQELSIKYKININENDSIDMLSICPTLRYKCSDIKPINLNANKLEIKIKEKEFFNCDSFVHKVNKVNIANEEILEHSIYIKNSTDTYISNISLIENIPIELEFVKNTLIVNGINRVEEDISQPIKLGDIEPEEEISIKYKTIANSEFKSFEVNSILNYDTNRRSITQYSNSCKVNVVGAIFNKSNFIKSIESKNLHIGETVVYTISIVNQGNIAATGIIIKDILPKQLKFIEESIEVNEILRKECDIEKGILIDSIKPKEKIIIKYKAIANGICTNEKTFAQIFYTYQGIDKILTSTSLPTETTVTGAKIGENNFLKETSTNSCQIGDIITVRLTIENTGNIDCESLKIYENPNSALEFIENSLRIEGKESEENNIFEGINIYNLKIEESFNITYQVKVIDYPRPNPIDNRTILNYTYIKDGKLKTKEIYSNRNKIYINNPKLKITDTNTTDSQTDLVKYISYKDYAFFNLCFENLGNVGIEDINMKFIVPEGFTINEESIKINNKQLINTDNNSIKLPNLNVAQKVYVSFYAKHNYGNDHKIDFNIYVDYIFKDIKTRQSFKKNMKLKEVITIVNPDIEITKFISDEDIQLDREFTKNINIKNTGNIQLENIILQLNEGEFLKQCENSLFINSQYIKDSNEIKIEKIDVDETINIAIRYKLKYIPLCETVLQESIVSASYKLFDNQEYMKITKKSNKLNLNILSYDLMTQSRCNNKILSVDEISSYIFKITNVGNTACNNSKIIFSLPNEIEFIEDSLSINGKRLYMQNTKSGIDLGALNYSESITVSFDFRVIKLPYKNKLSINAIVEGIFYTKDSEIKKSFDVKGDIIPVENISLSIIKSVSHDYLQSGDILKVHNIIQNSGSICLKDIYLKDNNDTNLTFINNSVNIEGIDINEVDPINGFKLPDLDINESILVSYEYEYTPRISNTKIIHFGEVEYSYESNKDKRNKISNVKSNKIYIEGALSTFKQFNIEKEYVLKDYDPNIKEIISVISDTKIDEFYEIDSIKNKSYENVNSTGKKVIVKGTVVDRIEYLTDEDDNSLYMITRNQPFTIFINLPNDYTGEEIYFKSKCEDVFYKSIDERNIFVSSLISIEGAL